MKDVEREIMDRYDALPANEQNIRALPVNRAMKDALSKAHDQAGFETMWGLLDDSYILDDSDMRRFDRAGAPDEYLLPVGELGVWICTITRIGKEYAAHVGPIPRASLVLLLHSLGDVIDTYASFRTTLTNRLHINITDDLPRWKALVRLLTEEPPEAGE